MIARKLEPGEIWLSRRNMAVCFEGEFDFEWLDEAIGVLTDQGLSVILCTPTAAPP